MWSLASTRVPIQTMSAIFQSSVSIVYLISIPILGEKATNARSLAVILSVIGVVIACTFSPTSTHVPFTSVGLVISLCGEFVEAFYNVWFKYTFDDPGLCHTILIRHACVDACRLKLDEFFK